MKKIFMAFLLLLGTVGASAQSGTNSPYSQYGLGVLADQSSGFSRGMNGLALGFRDSKQVNALNPASYSSVDSLTFIFDAGYSIQKTNFEENGKKMNANNADFEYVVAAFRLTKGLGLSLGLLPFTNIGYNYSVSDYIGNSRSASFTNTYSGTGGIRQAYLGAGWEVSKGLSVGANISYLWGDYEKKLTNTYSDNYMTDLTKVYSANVKSYKLNLGMQYTHQLKKDQLLTLGATFSLGHEIGGSPRCLVISNNKQTGVSDSIKLGGDALKLEIPMAIGVGAMLQTQNKWKVGIDYTLQRWGSVKMPETIMKNETMDYQLQTGLLKDRHKLTLGGEYCANPTGRKFLSRIRYRAGVSYATPYLNINGKNGPREYAASLGFGIPIINGWNNRSILNISGQWVRNDASSMITENTFRLNIGLTFNEQWFQKWKFR
jgi:hypothetical protein